MLQLIPVNIVKYVFSRYYFEDNHRMVIKGRSWMRVEDYLIWTSEGSFFQNEDEMWSVFIPINSAEEILVGKFNQISGLATELHSANVKISSLDTECFMELKITFLEEKDYMFSILQQKRTIHLQRHKTENLCKATSATTPSRQFLEWDEFIHDLSTNSGSPENNFQVLSYLKPELSEVDFKKNPKKFLSNVTGIYRVNQIKI